MVNESQSRVRVIRVCCPRYDCRACETIHAGVGPEHPIANGLASPALLAAPMPADSESMPVTIVRGTDQTGSCPPIAD